MISLAIVPSADTTVTVSAKHVPGHDCRPTDQITLVDQWLPTVYFLAGWPEGVCICVDRAGPKFGPNRDHPRSRALQDH